MIKEWAELTPAEKREERFKRWISPPGAKFASPDAAKAYQERTTRLARAFNLQEPDRVPVFLPAGFFAASYAGTNLKTVMYDYAEMKRAFTLNSLVSLTLIRLWARAWCLRAERSTSPITSCISGRGTA